MMSSKWKLKNALRFVSGTTGLSFGAGYSSLNGIGAEGAARLNSEPKASGGDDGAKNGDGDVVRGAGVGLPNKLARPDPYGSELTGSFGLSINKSAIAWAIGLA